MGNADMTGIVYYLEEKYRRRRALLRSVGK